MRKIILDGHLGNDPEVKQTTKGNVITTFRFANKKFNEENACWYNVTIFDPIQQNFCQKNLKKGSSVIIDGEYSDRIYINKNGQPEIGREIRASSIDFAISGSRSEMPLQVQSTQVQPTAASPVQTQSPSVNTQTPPAQPTVTDGNDDDLPF